MFRSLRRETFLLRGRTLADFINKTKTEKWKALVEILGLDAIESLREDLQRARNDLRKAAKTAEEEVRVYRRALSAGADTVTENRSRQSPADLRNAGRRPPQSLDQVVEPSWITAAVGASASVCFVRSREPPGGNQSARTPEFDKDAFAAWNALVSSDRARLLPRASLVREAKRLFEARSIEAGRARSADRRSTRKRWREDRARARRDDGSGPRSGALSRSRSSSRRTASRVLELRRAIYDRARELQPKPRQFPRCRTEDPRPGRGAGTCRHRRDHEPSLGPASLGQGGGQAGATNLASQTQHTRQSAGDAGGAVPADQCLATGREKGRSRARRWPWLRPCSMRISRSKRRTWAISCNKSAAAWRRSTRRSIRARISMR